MRDSEREVLALLSPQCVTLETRARNELQWCKVHVKLCLNLWWCMVKDTKKFFEFARKKNDVTSGLDRESDRWKPDGFLELVRGETSKVEWLPGSSESGTEFQVVVTDVCREFRAPNRKVAEAWKKAIELGVMVWTDLLSVNLSDSEMLLLASSGGGKVFGEEENGIDKIVTPVVGLQCASFVVKEIDAVIRASAKSLGGNDGFKAVRSVNDFLVGAPYAGYAFRVVGIGLALATKLAEETEAMNDAKELFEMITTVLFEALQCAKEGKDEKGFYDFLRLIEKVEVAGKLLERYSFSSTPGRAKSVLFGRPYRPTGVTSVLKGLDSAVKTYLGLGSYRSCTRISNRIMDLVRHNSNLLSNNESDSAPWPKVVSFSIDGGYVGNTELLQQINDVLFGDTSGEEQSDHSRLVRKCIVSGMGGIGKTEIVKEYARRNKKFYKGGVYWVQAERQSTLLDSFRDIREQMTLFVGPEKSKLSAHRKRAANGPKFSKETANMRLQIDCTSLFTRVGQRKGHWLVIFDNADNIKGKNDFRLNWLPRRGYGHVLLTTRLNSRHREFREFVGEGGPMSTTSILSKLCASDARALLLRRAGRSRAIVSKEEGQSINKIVGRGVLDGHPLAIVQAGGYIGEQEIPFQEYLMLIDQFDAARILESHVCAEERSIMKTFAVSKRKLSAAGRELLSVLCWLPPEGIAESEVMNMCDDSLNGFEQSAVIRWMSGANVSSVYQADVRQKARGRELVTELCKFGLVRREQRSGESFITAHRLVYSVEQAELDNMPNENGDVDNIVEGRFRASIVTAMMLLQHQIQIREEQAEATANVFNEVEFDKKEVLVKLPRDRLYHELACFLETCDTHNAGESVRFYQHAASLGNRRAMNNLGLIYSCALGVEKDEKAAVEWYRKAADLGNTNAMFNLGNMCGSGSGISKDEKAAVEWYRKAADLGHTDGMVNLGNMCGSGSGISKDEKAAVEWYRKAADLGYMDGMLYLGIMLEKGLGISKDEEAAAEWYKKAVELEGPDGMTSLGTIFEHGLGISKDETAAVEWYRKAADLGDTNAMFNLGNMCGSGSGISKDEKAAVEWYKKAADLGNSFGMVNLGNMCRGGRGLSKDEKAAVEWYRKAADLGNTNAMFNLGNMCGSGSGISKDEKAAVEWYRKAADLGDTDGMVNLGNMCGSGSGISKDEKAAVEWYRKAADLGHMDGMLYLGIMLEKGLGISKDEEAAAEWYRKAADLGHPVGMFYLGIKYEKGLAVCKNEKTAIGWFRKAADLGFWCGMVNLGRMYEYGLGISKDEKAAAALYKKAAAVVGEAEVLSFLENMATPSVPEGYSQSKGLRNFVKNKFRFLHRRKIQEN